MNSDAESDLIQIRRYGTSGPKGVLLHGGPGAPGYMAPVAKRLGEHFRVIEPFQRKGDPVKPMTVARHILDLGGVIEAYCSDEKPILVGHSWGAMLAMAYAAAHPERPASIVLIGCGTFDADSRERMNAIRRQRMTQHVFQRMQERIEYISDPDECLKLQGKLMMQVDSYHLKHVEDEVVYYDALGHEQTWRDMLRLQHEGTYPAAFKSIGVPVLMLHGDQDPHPGPMIRDSLIQHIPHLQYHSWSQCGHYPWLEKAVRKEFYDCLMQWLSGGTPPR